MSQFDYINKDSFDKRPKHTLLDMSTGIRSNKENIVAFRTPHAKNDGVKLNPRTPGTIGRIPFGGKNTNVRQNATIEQSKHTTTVNIDTIKKQAAGNNDLHLHKSVKSTKKATPLFDVPADELADNVPESLPDIEYTPRPEIDAFKDDDGLNLDIDFDFIRKSLRHSPRIQSTDEIDHELTFDVESKENPARKYLMNTNKSHHFNHPNHQDRHSVNGVFSSVGKSSHTQTSSLPSFMAPTKSALSKRTHKPTIVYRDPEMDISSDDILGNLEDQIY